MSLTKEYLLTLFKKLCLAAVNLALFIPILQLFVQLNNLSFSGPLVMYVIFVQLIFIFLTKWYLWLPIQFISSLYLVYLYFPFQHSFSGEWFRLFLNESLDPIVQMLSGEITILPNMLSLLLIMSLFLVTSYALLKRFNSYLSFFVGLGYLLILQVFTTTDLFNVVLSTLLFGFLLIGIAHIKVTGSWRNAFLSLLLLSTGGILFTGISLWAMRNLTQQQEWTASQADNYYETLEEKGFYKWIDRYSPGGVSSRSGFNENDTNLGGPLTQRHNTVFIAHTSEPHYWLIESKEIYTGKGWETPYQNYATVDLSVYESFHAENSNIDMREIDIELSESFSYIPYTYETLFFDFAEKTEDIHLLLESPAQQYILEDTEENIDAYTLILTPPREVDLDLTDATFVNEYLGDNFYETYTQLPTELPERVIELAHSITSEATTPYEQVRAIERYLKEDGGFRYSLSEAAYIPEDRDYVDHFLFDTKVGYCDNYSTAMVVLCRALGIPTRWAKGFNSGEKVTTNDESYYEITNANAHSWPEVYFTDYGWIPFEPTPPFDQTITDETTLEEDVEDTLNPEEEQEDAAESSDKPTESFQETVLDSTVSENIGSTVIGTESWISQYIGSLVALTLMILLILLGFFKRWSIVIWLVKKLLHSELLTFPKQLSTIDKVFQLKKKPQSNQTIRQYYEQWVELVPAKEPTILAFIQLLEKAYYAPVEENATISSQQKDTLVEMISVLEHYQH